MTRINTNVSSLTAQKSLARSNASMQQALTRLSTGLRINTGKDDPAGLVASEMLRSDIVSVERAVGNSERANQMIATADSALGQVSSLLNDIRGLVTEAANEGAMSADQIAANQLQIDSSLEAINRIAQTTAFQGQRLLDGSLAFLTTAGTNFSDITDLEITQANLGTSDSMSVDVRVIDAATQAEVKMTGSTYTTASDLVTLGKSVVITNAASGTLDVYSLTGVEYDLKFYVSADDTTDASFDGDHTITVTLDTDVPADLTVAAVADLLNTDGDTAALVHARGGTAGSFAAADDFDTTGLTYSADQAQTLTISAAEGFEGPQFNNMTITIQNLVGQTADIAVEWNDLDDRSELIINLKETATDISLDAIKTAVEGAITGGDGLAAGTLAVEVGTVTDASVYMPSTAPTVTGDTETSGGGVLSADLVMQLTGETGSEFLSFQAGTQMAHITSAVNAISDTLGMSASVADGSGDDTEGTLVLSSTGYGSSALIDVNVVSEGSGGAFVSSLSATRDTGTDINATVNGSVTMGNGNTLSLSTGMLSLEATIAAGVEETISFTISGGGALFQLGPDVVATQQARLGIESINAAQLRGEAGRLYELGSGRSAALATDSSAAAQIVDQVISKVTSLRGRLGAFQKTTLEPNIAALNDTLETLTEAESSIRDADFAAETAALTRAQILVQSGTSVLAIANSSPQNVLALLR